MTLEVRTPEVYTVMGVPVQVDGIAQIKVRNDDVSISTASEQFLSMGAAQIRQIALQTVEGHLRAILGMMTVEEIYRERDKFAQRVQDVAATDLANMGLQIVSFTIRDIRDTQGYLDALGKPRIAQVKRDATIGEAEANRDAIIRSAQANQEGQQAKFAADTQIAEADRDYKMKLAEYTASVNQKKAEADLAYDLQKYQTQQLVTAEQVKVQVVEKENLIQVQEMEIQRREKELTATIERPADAERYRIQQLAEAEQFRLRTTAQGQADAIRATGTAEADANKARGLAEAEVIRQQGLATAEAMAKKAAAWREYNEAAIAQMFIDRLPEIATAIAAPLAKTEKIVVVSTGDGPNAGASKVTGDVTAIIAQLPPMVEALTGLKLEELVKRIPGMVEKTPPAAPEA
jgi:flotillin